MFRRILEYPKQLKLIACNNNDAFCSLRKAITATIATENQKQLGQCIFLFLSIREATPYYRILRAYNAQLTGGENWRVFLRKQKARQFAESSAAACYKFFSFSLLCQTRKI